MEMDRQTIMVLCCTIIGLTLFGGIYLSSPKQRDPNVQRVYAQDDVRYKLQQEELKKPKPKKKAKPAAAPVTSSSSSSGGGDDSGDDESNEEPPISDGEPQEEPSLE
jgi:hypothetical protein